MKTSVKITVAIIAMVLIIAIAMIAKGRAFNSKITMGENKPIASEQSSPASHFTWRYENGDKDKDGLPLSRVFLDVIYHNGKVVSIKVDEVQGSCNSTHALVEDKDRASGSTKIQCYAAGLGEWYKIVKGDNSYKVLRKFFVEAEPDSTPAEYNYETVAEVPLFQ